MYIILSAFMFDESVSRVLANPKYNILTGRAVDIRQRAADLASRFVDTILRRLLERLDFPGLTVSDAGSRILYGAFILAGVITVVFIAYFIVKRFRRGRARRYASELFDGVDVESVTVDGLFTKAGEFAAHKSYRDAVRYGFIAVLLALDKRDVITLHEYKTNGQLKREVKRSAPPDYEVFAVAADAFNRAWFGSHAMDDAAYDAFIRSARTLAGAVKI